LRLAPRNTRTHQLCAKTKLRGVTLYDIKQERSLRSNYPKQSSPYYRAKRSELRWASSLHVPHTTTAWTGPKEGALLRKNFARACYKHSERGSERSEDERVRLVRAKPPTNEPRARGGVTRSIRGSERTPPPTNEPRARVRAKRGRTSRERGSERTPPPTNERVKRARVQARQRTSEIGLSPPTARI
jgi:hypothetical protein